MNNKHYDFTIFNNKKALFLDLNNISIKKASYGSEFNHINVLYILIKLIRKKVKAILVNNTTFEKDPHYGKVKKLSLVLSNEEELVIDENNFLIYDLDYSIENIKKLDDNLENNTKNKIINLINFKKQLENTTKNNITNKCENYQNYYKDNIVFKPIIGFIILRSVRSEKEDRLWIKCYDSIRKFYKNRILIIDDNSDYKFLTVNKNLENTSVIFSEYKGRGELLPLYYFYINHFCDRIVILHDSMFINKYYDFENINNYNNYTRIFSFSNKWYTFDVENLPNQLEVLENSKEILNFHYRNMSTLVGCFGCSIVIDYNFISYLQDRFNIFNLIQIIRNRNDRKVLERTLSCILEKGLDELKVETKESLFGTIHSHIDKQRKNKDNIFIYKEFVGR
uniref:Uncharacterized protein n=1 Tax=viral metagenome TaxID=1070528 RepID=A0A6C0J9C3_9ZZZZ